MESKPPTKSGASGSASNSLNELFNPIPSQLTLEERIQLVSSVGEEIVTREELERLLQEKQFFTCYDGFEPSGRMHIAQGIMKAVNVNKITKAGGIFIFWVADWFGFLNNKMGGDLEKIQVVGCYFVEVWKALGMNLTNVKFLWASEEINRNCDAYWKIVFDIARVNTISRIKKCSTIMGRQEGDDTPAAQILYPCMQCADIFFLNADICQLGMDQRKVNVLAREYCDSIKKKTKPIILSHHMLMGLKESKMSKSDPDSAIFMEDSVDEVNRKIMKSACPPQNIVSNPIIDYCKHIIFPCQPTLVIERSPENGGSVVYEGLTKLEQDFMQGMLHPLDLKLGVAAAINHLIQPVRDHFLQDPHARQLLESIRSWQTGAAK